MLLERSRFGHAATDRQFAYLPSSSIAAVAERNPIESACVTAISEGVISYAELEATLRRIEKIVEDAFEVARKEPKITKREEMISRNSQPLATATPKTDALASGTSHDGTFPNLKWIQTD